MPNPSRTRSIVYAAIAGTGLAAISYWLGSIRGAEDALDQYRDLAFQTTDDALRRQLRYDALLSAGRTDEARRALIGTAWSQYSSLEDDARGAFLPPSQKMKDTIAEVRGFVSEYCGSGAAAFHASTKRSVCKELAARANQRSDIEK